eukprot:TRINITY_DN73014_c0_g1_i1.p2 TRINITY_DN73014_c0_g1~~TRINITY_DN73014_c0_g1_i1.p2  ORF type:complete len:176 (+),score=26.52 TRINITY_DN73014_c0_g1_i1:66-593(+)
MARDMASEEDSLELYYSASLRDHSDSGEPATVAPEPAEPDMADDQDDHDVLEQDSVVNEADMGDVHDLEQASAEASDAEADFAGVLVDGFPGVQVPVPVGQLPGLVARMRMLLRRWRRTARGMRRTVRLLRAERRRRRRAAQRRLQAVGAIDSRQRTLQMGPGGFLQLGPPVALI